MQANRSGSVKKILAAGEYYLGLFRRSVTQGYGKHEHKEGAGKARETCDKS
jgi:hypothetical protein